MQYVKAFEHLTIFYLCPFNLYTPNIATSDDVELLIHLHGDNKCNIEIMEVSLVIAQNRMLHDKLDEINGWNQIN